ncbi:hypothetical protein A2U01_0110929, partial [Trifolium medium]|nr:hypothetical protein [Trifolium medium]
MDKGGLVNRPPLLV